MYSKIKLIFMLGLTFLLFPVFCSAKTIEIDGKEYDVASILDKDGYKYDASKNTLTLTNTTLKSIRIEDNLKIVLVGDNYLKSENQNAIDCKSLEIEGEGTLTISSGKNGIYASRITINRTNLNINSKN